MARPVVLISDPSAELGAIAAKEFRSQILGIHVLTCQTREQSQQLLKRLSAHGTPIALVLTDIGFLREQDWALQRSAAEAFPEAKRLAICNFEDRPTSIQAMAEGLIDYYVTKPWTDGPGHLPKIIQEMLDDWNSAHTTKSESSKLYGHRWAKSTHELKDFLCRNQAPFEWIDVDEQESDPSVQDILKEAHLPVVVLPGGERINCPTTDELAEKIGLKTHPDAKHYDLVLIGGGPTGLAAGVYAASEGIRTLLVERVATGGQAGCSSMIENYLGFPEGLSGAELARRATDQATKFGVEILAPQEAVGLKASKDFRIVRLKGGEHIGARCVLLAMGVSYRRLNVPGEDDLFGAGVYYGATYSEAVACSEEHIAVAGSGNSAGQAVLHFAEYARKVTLVVSHSNLAQSMSQYLVDRISSNPKVQVLTDARIEALNGQDNLQSIVVRGREIEVASLFVFVGAEPHTDWLPEDLCRDPEGFVMTGRRQLEESECKWRLARPPMHLETSIPGVFAAGDVRSGSTKRIASGVGEGAAAVQLIHEYIKELKA